MAGADLIYCLSEGVRFMTIDFNVTVIKHKLRVIHFVLMQKLHMKLRWQAVTTRHDQAASYGGTILERDNTIRGLRNLQGITCVDAV